MADPEECRVFVGGLSWETTDKRLEQAFRRFGKVLDAKVMVERDTGRPRGFGFVTFSDEQSMEDAITGLHNGELDGRIISVNKAQPKMMGPPGDRDYGFDPPYENGSGPRGGGPPPPRGGGGNDNCFRCGKPGHWARECPYGDGGRDRGRYPPPPPPPRYGGGGGGGSRYDRYGGPPPSGSRYGPDYRDRSGPARYGDSGYDRGGRGGYSRGADRYGSGGPARYDRGFRDRPAPYGRPAGRSNYDDRY